MNCVANLTKPDKSDCDKERVAAGFVEVAIRFIVWIEAKAKAGEFLFIHYSCSYRQKEVSILVLNNRYNGFHLMYDDMSKVLIVRIGASHDVQDKERFEHIFYKTLNTIRTNGNAWYVLIDFTRSTALSEEFQHALGELLVRAKHHGMRRHAVVARSLPFHAFTERLARRPELKIHFYFQSEEDAVRWLTHCTCEQPCSQRFSTNKAVRHYTYFQRSDHERHARPLS
jgi:hypothetical protein